MAGLSNVGDLTPMAEEIRDVMENYLGERPVIALAFSLPSEPHFDVHWVTNVSREDGIMMFNQTAQKMAEQN